MKKIISAVAALALCAAVQTNAFAFDGFPSHEPYGEGVGAMPGRVVWSYEPSSVDWDGNGYWWEPDNFDEGVIRNMVSDSIAALGGASTAADGWRALFENRNERNGESGGYKSGEKIAIKANINGSAVMDDDTSGKTQMSYTNPVLLKALLTSLVEDAGVKPSDITVYDVSRLFPDYMEKMCTEGILSGVNFVNRDNGIADENAPIVWSHEFSGAVNYLPTCVTEAKYMINLANLKGHSYGITLCGKNHFGSFINGNAMRPPEGANLHQWLTRNEMGIYSPLVDLMANKHLGGKTVLYMLDAIICAPSEGASITIDNSKWKQEPFGGDFTSSIFVSQDPVAIDSVGADFLINEPAVTDNNYAARDTSSENYLHEAGLVKNSPSGTVYTDSFGETITNLGVHEHWNNPSDKQYSRNLGKDEGIELVKVGSAAAEAVSVEYDKASGTVTVSNAPENSTLITAFYKNNVLSGVKQHKGSGTFMVNIGEGAEDADKAKIFLWDMKTIRPLCEAKEIITATSASADKTQADGKILVAYFSATNNTEGVAEKIAEALSADIYEITPQEPYTEADLNYNSDCRANREQNDDAARPAISGSVENMQQYDTVFVGYPIWWGNAPKIIFTFLESYDFDGKTIIPFCTSGSSPIGSTAAMEAVTKGAKWLDGRRFSGGASSETVMDWVNGLGLNSISSKEVSKMKVQIGNAVFTATLEDNAAVRELVDMMKEAPVTIDMSDYSGFEKVGSLGRSLTASDSQMTTNAGDIVLYNNNQIVMFYGSNSWSYTKIGHIDDLSGWEEALGGGNITAVFSLAE